MQLKVENLNANQYAFFLCLCGFFFGNMGNNIAYRLIVYFIVTNLDFGSNQHRFERLFFKT